MTGYDEALDWFRADPGRVRDLDDVDNRSAAITLVNAALAGIARGAPERGDDESQDADTLCTECRGAGVEYDSGYYVPGEQFIEPPSEDMCAACLGSGLRHVQDLREENLRLRAGSLPAMPPEVTEALTYFGNQPQELEHIQYGERVAFFAGGHAATVVRWVLSGTGERAASEPRAADELRNAAEWFGGQARTLLLDRAAELDARRAEPPRFERDDLLRECRDLITGMSELRPAGATELMKRIDAALAAAGAVRVEES